MSENDPTFAELCAYVDGELSADDAARIADVAARYPAVAAQIAQLSRLKSLMPEAVLDGADVDIDLGGDERSSRRWHWHPALAASILVALISFGAAALFQQSATPGQTLYEAGLERHRDWSRSVDGHSRQGGREAGRMETFIAPDLSAAQLSLRVSETFDHGPQKIVHFGYVGSRGCKLSFFVLDGAAPPLPEAVAESGRRQAAWSVETAWFLAIADGMEQHHFDTIVTVLRDYSIDGQPPAPPQVDQLVASRSRARPCVA